MAPVTALIRMKEDFTILFSPNQTDQQARGATLRVRLLRMPVQPGANDM
jgi:hypothetical protein